MRFEQDFFFIFFLFFYSTSKPKWKMDVQIRRNKTHVYKTVYKNEFCESNEES